ncbi:ChaN family lipoprotein [bacterium]|nr:ChaN family lipoprotein [bacterium]
MLLSLLALFFAGFSPASSSYSAPAFAVVADTVEVTSEHFRIYRSDGMPATIADVQAALAKIDVVFVGEQHDDPVSHFVEREVLKDMYNIYGQATALSMEMFSRDVQYIVDEYLAGLISDAHFQQSSSPWSNYVTDYKPQVDFAKEHGLDVIAANAPRRYANRVTRMGRQSLMDLSDQALSYVAPQPYGGASETYTAQWNKVMAEAMASMGAAPKEEDAEMKHEMAEGEHKMAEHKMEGMKHEMAEGDHAGTEHEMEHGEMDKDSAEYKKMHAEHMAAGMKHEMAEGEHKMEGMKHEMAEGEHKMAEHKMEGMKHEMAEGEHKMAEHKIEMGEGHEMDMNSEEHKKMHAEHMAAGMKHEEGEGEHKMGEMKHEMAEGEHKMAEHKMEGMKHEAPAAAPAPSSGQHGGDTMLDAQSLWDATMAWSIAEHLTRKPGSKVVHMVGGFHSETGTGTPEHLIQYRPGTRFMVITMKTTDDINTFDPEEHAGMGDFVILGDASLPRTYGTRTR